MASNPVVPIRRDRLFSSPAFRALTRRERGAFLATLCLLARNDRSLLEGCLCVGSQPMSFQEWATEVGERRRGEAQAVWDRLFARGLLEWHEHENGRYPRVALPFFHRPWKPRRRTQGTDTAAAGQAQGSVAAPVEGQGVATRVHAPAPIGSVTVPVTDPSLRSGSQRSVEGGAGGARPAETDPPGLSATVAGVLARIADRLGYDDGAGNGNGPGNGPLAPREGNGHGNCAGPGDPRLTPARRDALVARIEQVTGDRHSRANWCRLVDALGSTPEGLDALLGHLCDVEDAVARRAPGGQRLRSPGAVLNKRLREEARRRGRSV